MIVQVRSVWLYSFCSPSGASREVSGPAFGWLAAGGTRLLSQWQLLRWRVNGT